MHEKIRTHLTNFETEVYDHCGKKVIKAIFAKKLKKRISRDEERYLSFVLMKKNQDTQNVITR